MKSGLKGELHFLKSELLKQVSKHEEQYLESVFLNINFESGCCITGK